MKKAIFCVGDLNAYYVGYTFGTRWNGWEIPFFNKETVNRILADLSEEASDISRQFHWEGDTLIETDEDGERANVFHTADNFGELHYQLGNGWVWEEHEISRPHAQVLVKDLSGRGFDWTLTAFEHAIDNVEDTELVEFLSNCYIGEEQRSDSFKTIVIN